jgi:hypothetical protein
MTGIQPRYRRPRSLAVASALGLLLLAPPAPATPPQGFHATPKLGFAHGDHHLDLSLAFRYRWENWKAFTSDWDAFHGLRTRVALDYRFRDRFRLLVEGQQAAVLGLGRRASGAGALYRANSSSGSASSADSVRLSRFFAELRPAEGSWARLGRQWINQGTLVSYDEENWTFLKRKRLSQRLVGTVDWTHGARAYDGAAGRIALGDHLIHAFVAEPTTGVFDVDDAMNRQKKIVFGGLDWTARRGALVENTEIGAFFIGYSDGHDPDRVAGLFGDIEVYTLGASWLGVYPLGPGRADVVVWGAIQAGDYRDEGPVGVTRNRDQLAGAVIAELGYQLPELWSRPWLRVGVNYASGDDDPDDGDRSTFFNLLPTNHLYYGYTDQLALQNLVDLLVQLKVAPLERLGVELTYHRFWLAESDDFRWAGTGAFSRNNLGYVRNPSNGSTDVGHELDVVLRLRLIRGAVLSGGYARLWGGDVFDGLGQNDANFGYLELALSY